MKINKRKRKKSKQQIFRKKNKSTMIDGCYVCPFHVFIMQIDMTNNMIWWERNNWINLHNPWVYTHTHIDYYLIIYIMENVFHKTMRILNRRLLKNSCLANFHFHKQWARKKRDRKEKKTFKIIIIVSF